MRKSLTTKQGFIGLPKNVITNYKVIIVHKKNN